MTDLPGLHRAPLPAGRPPLVSICIPTLNRSDYIDETLRSALAQTYEPLEVVVVDDGSTDDTVERVRSCRDPRIRLYVNHRRLGMGGNGNRALQLSCGQLIKFLDSDDVLDPECVAKMASRFSADPAVGLVFSRRRVEIDPSADEPRAWLVRWGELHTHFQTLESLNDGRIMLAELLDNGLRGNWIGEPSAVMAARSHLQLSGGFSRYVKHSTDFDLWVRLLPHSRVGFIDEHLVTYRWGHPDSESVRLGPTRRHWLDRLWTLEALARDQQVRQAYAQVDSLLEIERRQAYRTALRGGSIPGGGRVPVSPYLTYVRFRTLAAVGRRPPLYAELPEQSYDGPRAEAIA